MGEHIIKETEAGLRLDRWFKKAYPRVPHSLLEKNLRKGLIRVNGKRAKSSDRLETGYVLRMPNFEMRDSEPLKKKIYQASPEDARALKQMVIFEDNRVMVLNKPAGLAVQGGSSQTHHLDGMLQALAGKGARPLLVHRLDRDTSGVLVLAKNARIAAELGKLLQGREIEKIYWALVCGVPRPREGEVNLKIAKGMAGDREKMLVDEDGQRAVSRYRVVESVGKQAAWVELEPVTGRTHQLRVHMSALGCPIIGDMKYGCHIDETEALGLENVLHLHARRIVLPAFAGGGKIRVEAPLPPHMRDSFSVLGMNFKKQ